MECIWLDECPYSDECELCMCGNYEAEYLSREDFYKDWFEYLERDTKD